MNANGEASALYSDATVGAWVDLGALFTCAAHVEQSKASVDKMTVCHHCFYSGHYLIWDGSLDDRFLQ